MRVVWPLLILGVAAAGGIFAVARQRELASEMETEQVRGRTLAIVLAPTFHDYAQMEMAAQWLESHGYGADALRVRQDIQAKGGHVIVAGTGPDYQWHFIYRALPGGWKFAGWFSADPSDALALAQSLNPASTIVLDSAGRVVNPYPVPTLAPAAPARTT